MYLKFWKTLQKSSVDIRILLQCSIDREIFYFLRYKTYLGQNKCSTASGRRYQTINAIKAGGLRNKCIYYLLPTEDRHRSHKREADWNTNMGTRGTRTQHSK